MTNDLRILAETLANSDYTVRIAQDETTDGKQVWFLTVLELPGCMAQGATQDEALKNLREARIEYILSLLDDGLPVPTPTRTISITTSNSTGGDVDTYTPPADFEDDLAGVVKPAHRHDVAEVAWVA